MELGRERCPPSIIRAVLSRAHQCARGVWGASVLFWSPNPREGSGRLSQHRAYGTVLGSSADGTSIDSISNLPAGGISSPEQGCVLPHHCERGSEGTECFPPLLWVFSPSIKGLGGSFPPPLFHDLGWFCEWVIVTGSGKREGSRWGAGLLAGGGQWPKP